MAVAGLKPGETSLHITAGSVAKQVPVSVRGNWMKNWPRMNPIAAAGMGPTIPEFNVSDGAMTINGRAGGTDQFIKFNEISVAETGRRVTFGLDYTGPELADQHLASALLAVIDYNRSGLYEMNASLPVPGTVTPGHYRLDAVIPANATHFELRIGAFAATPFTVTRLALMRTSEYVE